MKREKQFRPDKIGDYFRIEWLPLVLVTVSGLIYTLCIWIQFYHFLIIDFGIFHILVLAVCLCKIVQCISILIVFIHLDDFGKCTHGIVILFAGICIITFLI